jgi:tRNA (guanine10-N2)-methyltransferase
MAFFRVAAPSLTSVLNGTADAPQLMLIDPNQCQCFRLGDLDTNPSVRTWHLWWRRSHYPHSFADLEQGSLGQALLQFRADDPNHHRNWEQVGSSLAWTTVTALCSLHGHEESPFAVTRGFTDAEARLLASRSVFVHAVYRLWCSGSSHAYCAEQLESLCEKGALRDALPKQPDTIRFDQVSFGRRLSMATQLQNLQAYRVLLQHWTTNEQRKIRLSGADVERVVLLEDHQLSADSGARVHVARWLADGGQALQIHRYHLQRRPFIGTTSMDAELSFLMANVARVGPGQVVLDPYVGTGSILVSCAVAGATQLLGSDLDRWVLHGTSHTARRRHHTTALESVKTADSKATEPERPGDMGICAESSRQRGRWGQATGSSSEPPMHPYGAPERLSILDNFRYYGIPRHQWPELVRMDLLEPAWTGGDAQHHPGWCDAIVCDPPYGIREGTRQARCAPFPRQPKARVSSKRRAPFAAHLDALFRLAARVLRPGGRLVFWLPAMSELTEYDLPHHDALEYFGKPCRQRMRGGLSRYLLVLVKRSDLDTAAAAAASLRREVFYKEAPANYQRAHEDLAARLFRVSERAEAHLMMPKIGLDPHSSSMSSACALSDDHSGETTTLSGLQTAPPANKPSLDGLRDGRRW